MNIIIGNDQIFWAIDKQEWLSILVLVFIKSKPLRCFIIRLRRWKEQQA